MMQNRKDKSSQMYAGLGIGLICVIVGVPLWWKTTEVYRVQLPYSDINSLSDTPIEYLATVEVVCLDSSLSSKLIDISTGLQRSLGSTEKKSLQSKYRVATRDATTEELSLYRSAKNIEDFDKTLSRRFGAGFNLYYVVLLPESKGTVKLDKAFVGKHRSVYMPIKQSNISETVSSISSLVTDVVVRQWAVSKSLMGVKGSRSLKLDKESMRCLRSSPGYDITFTLASPQPEIIDIQWDIKHGIQDYLKPFLSKLDKYANISVTSQVLFFTGLVVRPQKDAKTGEFFYTEQDLPHMITPLESKLGSHASSNPALNFVVYVPTRDQSPLYLRDAAGNRVPSNAFLSPRWGGILILNVPSPPAGAALPHRADVDMRRMMEVFITQLRFLLNLHSQTPQEVILPDVGNEGITEWELDSWLRILCVENIATSIVSLQSLSQLLGQISNMVIKDDIALEVESAVANIKQAKKLLAEGTLEGAFLASRNAVRESEKAFFDPSLLELLYFPEDQKFAIYIPLFLPISIPIMSTMIQGIKWLKRRHKQKQE
ncbi:GPI transamidase component PIG-S-like isoform X2 [Gigantopelta aegis]|uniref:GPI transamidase component PIG-S-like isoform X2 n=1 Tax=Gigantopelta aegis TaxID=1735272 RepID=UPI001B88CA59|nr:GPI transamidase component PIG-S-like isoform X2 [Gigantopelta aegis]